MLIHELDPLSKSLIFQLADASSAVLWRQFDLAGQDRKSGEQWIFSWVLSGKSISWLSHWGALQSFVFFYVNLQMQGSDLETPGTLRASRWKKDIIYIYMFTSPSIRICTSVSVSISTSVQFLGWPNSHRDSIEVPQAVGSLNYIWCFIFSIADSPDLERVRLPRLPPISSFFLFFLSILVWWGALWRVWS